MLSKNKIKYIRSLEQKKYRREENAFLAEGSKLVVDLSGHFHCKLVVGTSQWLTEHRSFQADETVEVTRDELSRASLLKTPKDVLAVYEIPSYSIPQDCACNNLCLAYKQRRH